MRRTSFAWVCITMDEIGSRLMDRQYSLTLAVMKKNRLSPSPHLLEILPAYTGLHSLKEILQDSRARWLLWLEILFNDQLDLQPWHDHPDVQDAYCKACRWFTSYRSLIQSVLPDVSLPPDSGNIDQREYRMFAEALHFVAHQD